MTPRVGGSNASPAAATRASGAAMDRIYRRQRHIYDLTRKFYLLGRDRLIDRLDPPPGGTILEIGCGTGRNLIRAARRFPEARLFGIDISAEMLATARRSVAAAGLSHRITLAEADATTFDPEALFGDAGFDRVFMAYTLSMIGPWREALARGHAVVAPGGHLAVVDFGPHDGLPAWFRRLQFAWLARFHVMPRLDLAARLRLLAGPAAEIEMLYRTYAVFAVVPAAAGENRPGRPNS